MSYNIALTGHRPHKLDGYDLATPYYRALYMHLAGIVTDRLAHHEHVTLHSGLAIGADTVWSHLALRAREEMPERISFVAHVPTPTQPTKWQATDAGFWQHQVNMADEVILYAQNYTRTCMQDRNIGMVNRCDELLAVWDGTSGGTANAIQYGRKIGKPITMIDPAQFKN